MTGDDMQLEQDFERSNPGLRADAERNRDRLIAAGRKLFAEDGLGVSMAAVAREAGVGKATLSRHFADPQQLMDAVFADRMRAYVRAATEAVADDDPWDGFVSFVTRVCEMQSEDRGFADLLTLTFRRAESLEELRAEGYHAFVEIIARARPTGYLRDDFTSEDLILVLMANAGVVAATAEEAPDSWRRLLGHLLRAFANPDAPLPPMPPIPSSNDLYRAMARSA